MSDVIIRRSGIPGPGSDVLQPLVDEARGIVSPFQTITEIFSTWQQPEYTVESGFFDSTTGAPGASEAWHRISLAVESGQKLRFTALMRGGITALASFFDADGEIIGSPHFPGPDDTYTQYTNQEIQAPEGAVMVKSSGWSFGNPIRIERYQVDEDLATDMHNIPAAAKMWQLQDPVWQNGYYGTSGGFTASDGWRAATFDCSPGEWVMARGGQKQGGMVAYAFLNASGTVISYEEEGGGYLTPYLPAAYQAPADTVQVAVTTYVNATGYEQYFEFAPTTRVWITKTPAADTPSSFGIRISQLELNFNPLRGKNIGWIGNSIPAGGGPGGNYPSMVGDLLSANSVLNLCIGGASYRESLAQVRTVAEPKGYTGFNWGNWRVCLMKTLEDIENVADNWSTGATYRNIFANAPSSLSTDEMAVLTGSCFENRVLPHLDGSIDVWVLDNLHNEGQAFTYSSGAAEFNLGWIANNIATIDSVSSGTLAFGSKFDITLPTGMTVQAMLTKQLSGTAGGAGTYAVYAPGLIPQMLITGGPRTATTGGSSDPWSFSDMGMVPGVTPGYASYSTHDTGFAIGTVRKCIDMIRAHEGGRIPIVLSGYYEHSLSYKLGISEAEKELARVTNLPYIPMSELAAFTQDLVYSDIDGVLTPQMVTNPNDPEGPQVPLTMLLQWMPDFLHPHSDMTGRCNWKYAQLVAPRLAQACAPYFLPED